MNKLTYKEQQAKIERAKAIIKGLALSFLIISALYIYDEYKIMATNKELSLYKNLGSVYTDGDGNAFIRFNQTDPKQQDLLAQIQQYCMQQQISRCMPSYQALLNEGQK